jgi:hypothetical protein
MYLLHLLALFRLVGFDWFLNRYELNHKNPILYVIPIESILGKLPVVPVGDTGTIPHRLRNHFSGAPGDRRPGSCDGCRMWFVNSRGRRGHWDGPVICNEAGRAVRASVVRHGFHVIPPIMGSM